MGENASSALARGNGVITTRMRRPRRCARVIASGYNETAFGVVGPVAQRLEQGTHNPLVLGSNPSGPSEGCVKHEDMKHEGACRAFPHVSCVHDSRL